ncbi:MAG: hypothetical protein H0W84_00070 [Bacteroidetes bacterium]|nr:hypothetical protein [Bacteroidota bacterium]
MKKVKLFSVFMILVLFPLHAYCQNFTYSNVKIVSVTFSGNLNIRKDDGTGNYTAPHWLASNTTKSPVAYVSGNAPKVAAALTITCATVPATVWVRGHGSDLIEFPAVQVTVASSATTTHNMTYPATTGSKVFAAGIVRFFKPYSIDWEISFDNGTTWKAIETTTNTLYVTKSAPLSETANYMYHTVYDLSCRNAQTKSVDADIISAVWSEFVDHVVLNYNNDSLFYYKLMNTPNSTLSALLKYRDAQCYTFAQLFLASIKIQGIVKSNNYVYVTPTSNKVCGGSYYVDQFLVKSWTFGTPSGSGTCSDFPYKNTYTNLFNASNTAYNFTYKDVTDSGGIPGSCTSNPSSFFNNHQIAKIDGVYYDACYGVTFASISAIKTAAFSGWGFRLSSGGTSTCYFTPDLTKSDLAETITTY